MSYYRAGGYYRAGDYYRAGSIFSSIGHFVRQAAGVVSHLGIPGVSQVAGLVANVTGGASSTLGMGMTTPRGLIAGLRTTSMGGGQQRGLVNVGEGGEQTGLVNISGPGGRAGHRGMHIEKRGKHAGQLIPNRHMHFTNPKALKRAERRLRGFEKMAKRALRPLGLHVVRHTCQHSSHKARR